MDHNTLVALFKLLGYQVHVLLDQTAQVPDAKNLWGQKRLLLLLRPLGWVVLVTSSPHLFARSFLPPTFQSSQKKKNTSVSQLPHC